MRTLSRESTRLWLGLYEKVRQKIDGAVPWDDYTRDGMVTDGLLLSILPSIVILEHSKASYACLTHIP